MKCKKRTFYPDKTEKNLLVVEEVLYIVVIVWHQRFDAERASLARCPAGGIYTVGSSGMLIHSEKKILQAKTLKSGHGLSAQHVCVYTVSRCPLYYTRALRRRPSTKHTIRFKLELFQERSFFFFLFPIIQFSIQFIHL